MLLFFARGGTTGDETQKLLNLLNNPANVAYFRTTATLGGAMVAQAASRATLNQAKVNRTEAWRKQLANLEFSTNDAEATEAIKALGKLIADNGYEVPEGIRKMDLDQVYKTVQGNLQKETRMEFKSLDALVLKVTSTKQMGSDFDLGDMGRI